MWDYRDHHTWWGRRVEIMIILGRVPGMFNLVNTFVVMSGGDEADKVER